MSFQQHHHESSSATSIRRLRILTDHLHGGHHQQEEASDHLTQPNLTSNACLSISSPELTEAITFDTKEMRKLLDCHNLAERDWLFSLLEKEELFNLVRRSGKVFVIPDYNLPMEKQREVTRKRQLWLRDKGAYKGWCTEGGPQADLKNMAMQEVLRCYDLGLGTGMSVHFFLWGGAIRYLGSKQHRERFLSDTENYRVTGCFAMTELGHGSNVRALETVASYDPSTQEFVINTPCESAQKYWIGGAAQFATHAIVFAQLYINGKNEGVHGFIVQIRDDAGNATPNVRLAECGHKIAINGVDNGRIWFDNLRVPRENLLNAVAEVTPDGQYLSKIKDPDLRFAMFVSPLTVGRVTIATGAIYSSEIALSIAIRYALTRRSFSLTPDGEEAVLLDYLSHQRRLFSLLAKTYAMHFAGNRLKLLFSRRDPSMFKTAHVFSSAFKAFFSWHNVQTLQECREACGGQGFKTENRIGALRAEFDAQSTFEGDNTVMMQQASDALLADFIAAKKRNRPLKSYGLDHMNGPCPVIPSQLTSTDLRSTQFQIDAFRLRERDLLHRLAAEVSEYEARGETSEKSADLAFEHVKDLSRAFTDRSIMENFVAQETRIADSPLKNVLALVRSMYALCCIQDDPAFVQYGYITPENANAVKLEVAKLCTELRPHAFSLVSSFGFPDSFLSPIAFDWIDSNSWSSVKH